MCVSSSTGSRVETPTSYMEEDDEDEEDFDEEDEEEDD